MRLLSVVVLPLCAIVELLQPGITRGGSKLCLCGRQVSRSRALNLLPLHKVRFSLSNVRALGRLI